MLSFVSTRNTLMPYIIKTKWWRIFLCNKWWWLTTITMMFNLQQPCQQNSTYNPPTISLIRTLVLSSKAYHQHTTNVFTVITKVTTLSVATITMDNNAGDNCCDNKYEYFIIGDTVFIRQWNKDNSVCDNECLNINGDKEFPFEQQCQHWILLQ